MDQDGAPASVFAPKALRGGAPRFDPGEEPEMPGYRPQRLAEMIHRELSVRLREVLTDPAFPPVSITHVEVTRDLRLARVSWSPLGGAPPSAELTEAMSNAARRLRGPIARALGVRFAPELTFRLDDHLDEAVRLTSLLGRLNADREPFASPSAEGEE